MSEELVNIKEHPIKNLELYARYNFNTIAPSILRGPYEKMKLIAICTAQEAMKYDDVYTTHKQMERYVQDISVEDLHYLIFQYSTNNEEKVCIPLEYIQTESLVKVEGIKIYIEVPDAQMSDLALVQDALISVGISNAVIRSKTI